MSAFMWVIVLVVALGALTSHAQPYCYISNHDNTIHIVNVCVHPGGDRTSLCVERADKPTQRVNVTDSGNYAFTQPVPYLDTVTLKACLSGTGFTPIICNREPLCAAILDDVDNQITVLYPPTVYNAPPRAVCALRSDNYTDIGHVVNNEVTDFTTIHSDFHGGVIPNSIEIEFYTNRACTAFIPSSGLECIYAHTSYDCVAPAL